MANAPRLIAVETHPIQYRAPMYRWLAANGVELTVLYGSDCSVVGYQDPGFGRTFTWDQDLLSGYRSEFLGTTATGADSPEHASSAGLRERLAHFRPDAVLATGYSPDFHRQVIRATLEAGLPLLFRAETTHINPGKSRIKRALRDRWLRRLYKRCAALLYIGESSRRHYRDRKVPDEKLVFSPYAVDPTPFRVSEADRATLRDAQRAALGVISGDLMLLLSGKLIKRKNPLAAINALQLLPTAMKQRIHIIYLGDGALRRDVEAAAAKAHARVTITGFVNQAGLSAYYHAADLLLMPSHFEPWGLVVNDALHHGLPCVVSENVCSQFDLIESGRTGEVHRSGNDRALAQAIERATALAGRADVREHCRTKVSAYSPAAAGAAIKQALLATQR